MSQHNVTLNRRPMELALSGEMGQHVPPSRVFSILRRRKLLVLGIMLATGLPAAVFIGRMAPYYDAEATVMIHTGKTEFSDLQASASGTSGDSIMIRTQTDIIRSPAMAKRVVDRLNLVENPEFAELLHAPVSASRRIVAWLNEQLDGAPAAGLTPEPVVDLRNAAAAILASKVNVTNDGHSYLIGIRARTRSPQLSAAIANAYTQLYFDFNRDLKTAAIARGGTLLDAQIAPLKTRVEATENAVETYRERNGLVVNRTGQEGGRGATVADQQLSQASSELIVASSSLAQKEATLHAVQSAQHGGGGLSAIPEVVSSPLVQRLREQETELSNRQASLGETALDNNPALLSVQAGLADTRRRTGAEISRIVLSLSNEVAAARNRVDALRSTVAQLQGEVSSQSQATVALRQLESEADAARTVYKDYLGRYEQTSNQAALQEPEADLVSGAEMPAARSGPARLQFLVIAAIGSLLMGALAALGMERLGGGLRTPEDLESQTGLFPLGFVPTGSRRERAAIESASAYAASIDMVRSLLDHGGSSVSARVVVMTSALPGEGKSTLALSLAASACHIGGRALLIDCDRGRSSVAAMLRLPEKEVAPRVVALRSGGSPDSVYLGRGLLSWHRDVRPALDVLTLARSDGQIGSTLMAELRPLLEEARDTYDLVVLDAPPVLAKSDAATLATLADGAILVVRWAFTPAGAVNAAIRLLQAYNIRVLGGVLTRVKVKDLASSEGAHALLYRSHSSYFG